MKTVLEVRGISKGFPGVRALDSVTFDVRAGEVHALVGENGAGKSTLLKILSGALEADAGEVWLEGRALPPSSPAARRRLGIAMVYQELPLVPAMSVAENILLGNEPVHAGGLLVDGRALRARARELLGELGVSLDPDARVEGLGPGARQLVEIAKALALRAKVLLLDEPSASLSAHDFDRLCEIIKKLAAQGTGIVYISHRLEEIFRVADRVTILRDGKTVSTDKISELDRNVIISRMVGRDLKEEYPPIDWNPGPEVLRAEKLTLPGVYNDISFSLHRGEILGFAGLVGAGRTEVAMAIAGAAPAASGRIFIDSREARIRRPGDALRLGIGLLTEDRKSLGIIADRPIRENTTISALDRVSKFGVLLLARERRQVREKVKELDVRASSIEQKISDLSGGNQQKVLLGRMLHRGSHILIVDEPTRGVDVGARAEIYARLKNLAVAGASILMVSSDLPEVLGMSHRIVVMRGGRIAGVLGRAEATPESVMRLAACEED
ncbi:MAG: sugar ABC transporter ATP-binding protein [Planctomycetes bacterium]|nr:sugar ABC transporter ATP-binding protein [Planctomycetota bacterium]